MLDTSHDLLWLIIFPAFEFILQIVAWGMI